jgi:hypothetical protein
LALDHNGFRAIWLRTLLTDGIAEHDAELLVNGVRLRTLLTDGIAERW